MKRLNSSDSMAAFITICPSDEHSPRNTHVYGREFQSMLDGLDEEGCLEESGEKKRRLSVDQVKALEKNFEVENKLEPERKVKLALQLGLQPRQVAVWFQNRRARWKTKQLERDYGVLKANYDSLKLDYDSLNHDNESMVKQIRELKAKMKDGNKESNICIKEEGIVAEEDNGKMTPVTSLATSPATEVKDLNYESFNNNINGIGISSDSDSSAILNDENNSLNAAISSSRDDQGNHIQMSAGLSSVMNCFQFQFQKSYHPHQYVKMEEHNLFTGEETCNFFSDEQAPTLPWYCPDQWN